MAPHNLWLRCPARGEAGQPVACDLLYGHHFEPDGRAALSRSRLWLYAPGKGRQEVEMYEADEGLAADFTGAAPGVYSLTAEYDLGVYGRLRDGTYQKGRTAGDDVANVVHFVHYAKTLVPVGEAAGLPGSCGMPLEIVPRRLDEAEIDLAVETAGRPVPDCEVFAHCEGRRISRFGRTDGKGRASFGLFPGIWMFIVRRETPAGGPARVRVEGATLTLTVTGPE